MRGNAENRAEKYIKKHENYKKWLAFALCVSIITGTITLYILNKPATAMTEDGAKQVGLVLETADSEFEQGLIEEMNNNENNGGDQSGDVQNDDDQDGDDQNDDQGDPSDGDDDQNDDNGDANDDANDDDDDAADEASSEDSEESDSDASSSMSSDAADEASSLVSNKEELTYETVTLSATLVDEFGEEIDPEKYSNINLPNFNQYLVLDDEENPPYDNVKVKIGTYKYATYSYVKATIGSKVITGLKKEIVKVPVSETAENEDAADSAATYSGASTAQTKDVEVYSYTVDGSEYTKITEDTVVNFVYSEGTKAEYIYSDSNIKITAKLQVAGAIPEDAELVVTPITSESNGYNYDAYMDALNDNAQAIADEAGHEAASTYSEDNTLMYDIAFMYEGEEIQPAEGSVSISMEFMDKQLTDSLAVSSEEEITVVHLPIKEEVKEANEITTTQEATDITSNDIEVKTLTDATAVVTETEKIEFVEDSFSIFAVVAYQNQEPGTDTFESVLGDAVNFGIVSRDLTLYEAQTNFATTHLTGYTQFGNDLTNICEQTFMAGTVAGEFHIKGFAAYFIVPKEYASQIYHENNNILSKDTAYTTSEISDVVEDMLKYGRDASADLASVEKLSRSLKLQKDGDRYKVDTTKLAAGTYYVTVDDEAYSKIGQAEMLRIYKNSDQTIVFNVTASASTYYMHKFLVSSDGSELIPSDEIERSNKYDYITRTLIWNFVNADEVHSAGSVAGVFIAGKENAKWVNDNTSSGWLVFPNAYVEKEWHNTYTDVKQISGTAKFQAYKTIDGEDATVSGFKFTIYKQDSASADGWTEIETVTNDEDTPHEITFNTITYGDRAGKNDKNYQYVGLSSVGQSESFIYKLVETAGTTDAEGNVYIEDKTIYYAKVTATLQEINEYTNGTYIQVSAPVYYTDEACTKVYSNASASGKSDGNLPVFDNKTVKGSIGIALNKYLNDTDPGDLKFTFTIRALNKDANGLVTITKPGELTNDGSKISYSFDYDSSIVVYEGKVGNIYLAISEDDIDASKNTGIAVKKDEDYIIVHIVLGENGENTVKYYKYDYENSEHRKYIDVIKSGNVKLQTFKNKYTSKNAHNVISDPSKIAFYNEGSANLRIHKMVINAFGSDMVREGTKTDALLKNVTFRITNKSNGHYIVFTGFVDKACVTKKIAKEYPTGEMYDVVYNQSAQWTVLGLPAGTYTVEEVADGLTFTYDEASNTSKPIYDTIYSRVTKYDLTTDEEDPYEKTYGTGGENYRQVYSCDMTNLRDQGPDNVLVGSPEVDNYSHTQTVQVCNYYSNPVGPIQITKNFTGAEWTADMQFEFVLEPIGYSIQTSEGENLSTDGMAQPMPLGSSDGKSSVVLSGADATVNENCVYSAIAKFNPIPFRFEGTYYYKITETNTRLAGVKYDSTVYYVEMVVTKKHTTFSKPYTSKNMTHPDRNKYPKIDGVTYTQEAEDFWYLGANVRYATDESFNNVVARCELYLGINPDTKKPETNTYYVRYDEGQSVADVAFNNAKTGYLEITKKWIASDGSDDAKNHTTLNVDIWQRPVGTSDWTLYRSEVLSSTNGWRVEIYDLPIVDVNGNKVEYTVKEAEEYLATYTVTYKYSSLSEAVTGNGQSKTKVDGKDVYDTGYVITLGSDGRNFGSVEITNKTVYSNKLPRTGGNGTAPFAAAGVAFMLIAFAGMFISRKRNNKAL